jgi:hypothetical protein
MKRAHHRPAGMPAHDLLDKLSVIVGYCDLLNEMTEPGSEYARRVGKIREGADSVVKELVEHQRKAGEEGKKAG